MSQRIPRSQIEASNNGGAHGRGNWQIDRNVKGVRVDRAETALQEKASLSVRGPGEPGLSVWVEQTVLVVIINT